MIGKPTRISRGLKRLAVLRWMAPTAALVLPFIALSQTDISPVPLPTYSISSAVDIKPNILMVLDDSGSMDWTYMPDWADDTPGNYTTLPVYLTRNSSFNGLAYNPAVTYLPPVTFQSSGAKDTTTYPSQTGASTATGADTNAKPNWRRVKNDAYGVQSTSTSNLEGNAYYWVTVPGEYCDSPAMTNCTTASAPTGNFAYPAPLRWCSDSALTTCRALQDSSYRRPRIAGPRVATLTITSASSARITGILVDGQQIMSSQSTETGDEIALASSVASRINDCANATGSTNCTVYGYTAVASGNVISIMAPAVTTSTPVLSTSGTINASATSFAAPKVPFGAYASGTISNAAPPGTTYRVAINPANNSYSYPGTTTKASTRSDCAGTTCTFQEEMTNYANWHTYYRTRMQMMKTATARAFASLDSDAEIAAGTSRYRVGYLSLNNNTGSDFVNINEFGPAQKVTWYSKLLAANPVNGTPLRQALSTAGRLYGGKLNGRTLNGSVVTDPVQYSCQKNFTILSTDGYWNGDGGVKLNGTSGIGNHDGALPRPYSDGSSTQAQTRTSQLQQQTNVQTAQLGTLQKQILQLQKRESQLQYRESQLQVQTLRQFRTSSDGGSNWTSWQPWTNTSSNCSNDNNGQDRQQCQDATSGWSNTTSCRDTNWMNCRYVDGPWTNTSSTCTVVNQSSGSNNNWTTPARACQYVDGAWTDTTACAAVAKSNGSPYTTTLARSCQSVVTTPWANAASCAVAGPDASGVSTQCRYNFATALPTQTCAPAYANGNYSNVTVYANCSTSTGAWTNVSSCTVSSTPDANGETVGCRYTAWTGWSNASSCSALPPSPSSPFTVGQARECQILASGGTSNTLADVAAYYYNTDLRSSTATGADTTGTCDGPVIPPATTASNLCEDNVIPYGRDTNQKQHMTTHTLGLGVQGMMVYSPYQNNAAGQRVYVPDYWTQPSGDFYSVANGSTANPGGGVCSWLSSGTSCTWPAPSADSIANIDDLWHAAVNGHGSYFSASDPVCLADALKNVLAQIVTIPRPGTAAAAASSNPNVTDTDNYLFSSSYKSIDWYGELIMERINPNGSRSAQQWSAMRLLDCATTPWRANAAFLAGQTYSRGGECFVVNNDYTSGASYSADPDGANTTRINGTPVARKIFVSGGSSLVDFTWNNLSTTQKGYFSLPYIGYASPTQGLTQFCSTGGSCMGSTAQTSAAGEALVNYLRGDRTNEGTYFRARKRVLGDIVTSQAKYVKVPLQNYADPGFLAFKGTQSSLADTIYVGANDGMLHAFNALTGEERWAFIPSAVLPEIHRLADNDYANKHRFFVDGSPQVDYICPKDPPATCAASEWKTILVGGLNDGGKGYYALDITNPEAPALLWEFTDSTMGFTYTPPRIGKLRDGTWVVLVASGYNNSDGIGRLYVLNARTGTLIRTISTGTGTASSQSGLAKITTYVNNYSVNNTIEYAYGGDLLGNLWRFDVNDIVGPSGYEAQLIVTLKDGSDTPQPITIPPVTTTINSQPVLLVATGRYLGLTDLTTTQQQTVYAIKDKLDGVTLPSPRVAGSNFVNQSATKGVCPTDAPAAVCAQGQAVTLAGTNAVDWGIRNGWYSDFVNATGERAVTELKLVLGTLTFNTLKPQSSVNNVVLGCTGSDQGINAESFNYEMNYLNGMALSGTYGVTSVQLCVCVATAPSIVKTQDGTIRAITRVSGESGDGTDMGGTKTTTVDTEGGSQPERRISWRELVN